MLRAGLIGFPLTGKTTLFQLLTRPRADERAAATRMDAQVGVAPVPDPRLDRLAQLFQPRRRTPAAVEFADLAGRRGTQALLDVAPFREANALLHVIRLFRDEAIPHPAGHIDARRDAQAMEDELILADLGVAERRLERLARDLKKAPGPELKAEQQLLARCRDALEAGTPLRGLALDATEEKRLRGFQFLSAKPLLLVLNLDEADIRQAGRIIERADLEPFVSGAQTRIVAACAKIELEIAQLDAADAAVFLSDLGLHEAGLDRIIRATYHLLGYLSFFTVGPVECRAWSVPRGTSALQAAAEIHTDMARGFVRAEVVTYEHLAARGSLAGCREHGELRLEGKEYVVQDGDVIHFRFAT